MEKAVSEYTQIVKYNNSYSIIYHSIFGRPILVMREMAALLAKAQRTCGKININDFFDGYDAESALVIEDTIKDLIEMHILLDDYSEEDRAIAKLHEKWNRIGTNKVKYLSLIMSQACNFKCKYCIANNSADFNSDRMMSFFIAKQSIDAYMDTVMRNHLSEAYINFGGGEPLLNWSTINALLPCINDYRKKLEIPIRIGINTNMSLMTEDIAKILIYYDVEIAASLDGFRKANDSVRVTKTLDGTYDLIMRGFKIMEKLGHPLHSFAMTVTADNFSGVNPALINWAASHYITEVRIDIDVVGMVKIPTEDIVNRLFAVRRYAKTKGISVIGFWSRPAENLGLIPEEEDISFCGGECGNSICVSPNGYIYPCGYSNYALGAFMDINTIQDKNQYKILLRRRNLNNLDFCHDCPILGFCRGGCLITHEANRDDTKKLTSMCEIYRSMTELILRESASEMFSHNS